MNQFAAGRNGAAIAPNGPILLPRAFGAERPAMAFRAKRAPKAASGAPVYTTPSDGPFPRPRPAEMEIPDTTAVSFRNAAEFASGVRRRVGRDVSLQVSFEQLPQEREPPPAFAAEHAALRPSQQVLRMHERHAVTGVAAKHHCDPLRSPLSPVGPPGRNAGTSDVASDQERRQR